MSRPGRSLAAVALLAAGLGAGCRVEWGGGEIALENPAPPPDTTSEAALEPEQIPLPDGPFLYLARLGADGAARLTPIAVLEAEGRISTLEMPTATDPTFRARFDSAFLSRGREYDLLARGARLGSLIAEGPPRPGPEGCPSSVDARALLLPGQDPPALAFAVSAGASGAPVPERVEAPASTRSMNVAGPVLAERLIGGNRAFLARMAAMDPVRIPGDTLTGMAATYLIADSLAAGPPGEDAVSLFFLARFEPAVGFIPIWQEVRRYDSAEEKEAFRYVDWIRVGDLHIDIVRRVGGSGSGFALSQVTADGEERGIDWVEPEACSALSRVDAN